MINQLVVMILSIVGISHINDSDLNRFIERTKINKIPVLVQFALLQLLPWVKMLIDKAMVGDDGERMSPEDF